MLGPSTKGGLLNVDEALHQLDDEHVSVALAKASLDAQRCAATKAAAETAAALAADAAAAAASKIDVSEWAMTQASNVLATVGKPIEAAAVTVKQSATAVMSKVSLVSRLSGSDTGTKVQLLRRPPRVARIVGSLLRSCVAICVRGSIESALLCDSSH